MLHTPSQEAPEEATGPPPLTARAVLVSAALLTTLLVTVVLTVVHLPGPLDEATLADQRNGLLKGGPVLPVEVAGVRFGGAPIVLLFVRRPPDRADVVAYAAALPSEVRFDVVVQEPGVGRAELPTTVVNDPAGALARAVELPTPNDDGPGVGYAVVDPDRVVQYSTLDPSWPTNGFEAATVAQASE